jgi:hypothetical protein
MECDSVTALLSDQDGRVARRRDVRAHLRDCPECRRFADGIRGRSETLAGIAPLPAIAAAAMLKGALAGTTSGGAVTVATGGSAAGVGGGAAGGASGGSLAVASGAAKVASTGAILKSAAAIVAVAAVGGAVAVDQGHLLGDGGPSVSEAGRPASVARAGGKASDAEAPAASAGRRIADRSPRAFKPNGVEEAGLRRPARTAKNSLGSHPEATGPGPATTTTETDTSTQPGKSVDAPGAAKAGSRPSHPDHPAHPIHPSHPTDPARPARPAHLAKQPHQGHPSHPERAGHAPDAGADVEAGAETAEAPAAEPQSVEAREHPTHSTTPVEEAGADESPEATEPPGLAHQTN